MVDGMHVAVIGAGIFGCTAALELCQRGHRVTLYDAGEVPHPDAASTDISKVIRLDYGADELYTTLMERALPIWRQWGEAGMFHETGFTIVRSREPGPGDFEHDSSRMLRARGHELVSLDAGALATRFPPWAAGRYGRVAYGYFNPEGGWAPSASVVRHLAERAVAAGAELRTNTALATWSDVDADVCVVAAGAWTSGLVPELAPYLRPTGHPVLHFAPRDPAPFSAPRLTTWAADISTTGWYGFPANADGLVKIANHGPGFVVDPTGPRTLPEGTEDRFRAFVRDALPGLADAPIAARRLCLYADTANGDFWIDRHPEQPKLVVAGGGSGHGFKFAPVLGGIVADVVEGRAERWSRFAWRARPTGAEQARFAGDAAVGD
jgi:sarcosine oxidase